LACVIALTTQAATQLPIHFALMLFLLFSSFKSIVIAIDCDDLLCTDGGCHQFSLFMTLFSVGVKDEFGRATLIEAMRLAILCNIASHARLVKNFFIFLEGAIAADRARGGVSAAVNIGQEQCRSIEGSSTNANMFEDNTLYRFVCGHREWIFLALTHPVCLTKAST
jgi:hypothetical protein